MRHLLATIFMSMFFQGGGQPINIPIPITSFSVGYGSSFSQDLGITPAHFQEYQPGYTIEGVYTLSFSVANDPHSSNYPGYFIAKISFGTQELCAPDGWGKQLSANVTFICSSPGYLIVDESLDCDQNPCANGPAQGNYNLMLTVIGNGWAVNIKNASLTFTPQS